MLLEDRSIDIATVSESWLTAQSSVTTGILKSHGYSIFHDYRHHRRGGGTAIIYKGDICAAKSNIDFCPASFELVSDRNSGLPEFRSGFDRNSAVPDRVLPVRQNRPEPEFYYFWKNPEFWKILQFFLVLLQ